MISAPSAMRSRSRCTAAIILRSSASISSTISAAGSLSMPSVAGLIASVGSACHFERNAMWNLVGARRTRRATRDCTAAASERRVRRVVSCPRAHARRRAPKPWTQSTPRHRRRPLAGTSFLDAYLDHLRVERRLAAHTLESYGRDLVLLARYAAGREAAGRGAHARRPRGVHARADGGRPRRAVGRARGRVRKGLLPVPGGEPAHRGEPGR